MVKESKPYKMIFQVNWMLWGVLLSSQFFFIVMALPILRLDKMSKNLGEATASVLPIWTYMSLALVLALLSYYFHHKAYSLTVKGQKLSMERIDAQIMVDSFKRFQMNNMFSWAVSEFITLVGILSILFNAPQWVMFSMCLTGFSLQAFYYPRVGKFFEPFKPTLQK